MSSLEAAILDLPHPASSYLSATGTIGTPVSKIMTIAIGMSTLVSLE